MFALRLSFGWIDSYKKGVPSVPRPFLQVTEVVSVAAQNLTKSGRIYRITLFDGTHSTHALLHPSIEHLLVGLQNTVVKLLEFKNISLSSGLCFLIVSNLEPLLDSPRAITSPSPNLGSQCEPSTLCEDYSIFVPQPNKPNEFSDICIVVGDCRYYAHKLVLCSRSSYFRAMFLNGMQETGCQEISLDMGVGVFQCILRWMYTKRLDIEPAPCDKLELSPVFELWSASSFFCLEDLTRLTEDILSRLLSVNNVCTFWNHVHSMEAPRLEVACKAFIYDNLSAVTSSAGFLTLGRDLLQDLFGKTLPSTVCPTTKALALTRWFAYHQPSRLKRKLQECFTPEAKRQKLLAVDSRESNLSD